MKRDRPYSGQSHTDQGERGSTIVKGLTVRDIVDCYIRGVILSGGESVPDEKYKEALKGEDADLCGNDLFGFDMDKLDPIAISQNMTCEIEKMMGIFPNVSELNLQGNESVEEVLNKIGAPIVGIDEAAETILKMNS